VDHFPMIVSWVNLERALIIAVTDGDGDLIGSRNAYDEYGRRAATNVSRFQYAGDLLR
jgi:hypothetical protein